MSNEKDYKAILTKEFLTEYYVEKDWFAKDIATKVGCSVVTVTNYLRRHGIPVKPKYGKRETRGISPARLTMTEEYLRAEYDDKGRSLTSIAKELGCGITTVASALDEAGIARRGRERGDYSTTFTGIMETHGYLYVYMPEHPDAGKRGYVRLHRLLAEHYFGRALLPDEVVHHKNHDRQDNRQENLEIMKKVEHDSYHTTKRWESGEMLLYQG